MIEKRLAVSIGLPTPLYYCTGGDPIIYDGDTYVPKSLRVPDITLDIPASMQWWVAISDDDWSLHDDMDANTTDWDNVEVIVHRLTRSTGTAAWSSDIQITMTSTDLQQDMRTRWVRVALSGVVGLNKKAGLLEGSRTLFPDSPPPNAIIDFGGRQVRFPGGYRSRHPWPGGPQIRFFDRNALPSADYSWQEKPDISDDPVPQADSGGGGGELL